VTSRDDTLFHRIRGLHVTRRTALLVAAPAPFVAWLPGLAGPALAILVLIVVTVLVRRDISAAPGAAQLNVVRTMPVKLSMGVPNPVTLTIDNSSAHTAHLTGRESPPVGFVGKRGIGPLDIVGYGTHDVRLLFTPPARGAYSFGDVGIRTVGPMGLAGRQFIVTLAEEAKVYPDISAVHRYSLLARRGSLHEIGIKRARFAGTGTEFESLAEYSDGDDYRDIDWKATARRGAPVVRRFEAERSQTIMLAVDTGRLMTPRVEGMTKLDRAVNATLLLAYLATMSGDNVGLLVFGRDVQRYLPPRKGHRQFLAVLEALYSVEGTVEEPDYSGALRYLAARLGKRSLVVLMTDLAGTEPSRRLLAVLGSLTPRHLPLVITQRNRDVENKANRIPDSESDAFETSVASSLLHDKAAALRLLSARGSLVLDVFPEELSVSAVNRYLEIKARGRL
jgi:uncharacterized protein (DUF58 family)